MIPCVKDLRVKVSKREVRIRDLEPSIAEQSLSGRVCIVCAINSSAYTCPRCFIPYCSATCYAKHGSECTESFSRERVKDVLELEKKEGGGFSKIGPLNNEAEVSSIEILTRDEIPEGITEKEQERICSELEELGMSEESIGDPSKIPSRLLSRMVKLWSPWWNQTDEVIGEVFPGTERKITIGRNPPPPSVGKIIAPLVYDVTVPTKEETEPSDDDDLLEATLAQEQDGTHRDIASINHLIESVSPTAPKLQSLLRVSLAKEATYQILAMLLGYVVTMRAVNGDWADSPKDAVQLLAMSTPVVDPKFTPRSVSETVERWLRYGSPSLQNMTRKKIRSLLTDALVIAKEKSLMSFALLEAWMMTAVSLNHMSVETAALVAYTSGGGTVVQASIAVLDDVDRYCEEFTGRVKKTKTKTTETQAPSEENKANEENKEDSSITATPTTGTESPSSSVMPTPSTCAEGGPQLQTIEATTLATRKPKTPKKSPEELIAEVLSRKSFFLLLYSLDAQTSAWLHEMLVELADYIHVYLSDVA